MSVTRAQTFTVLDAAQRSPAWVAARLGRRRQIASVGVPNREMGTVERLDTNGRMDIRWESGQTSSFEAAERRHLDYGYAVTSHSSQGQTAGRVLVHVETDRASEKLVNERLAYVAVSRGQYDARIYTDDRVKLSRVLDRDVSSIRH